MTISFLEDERAEQIADSLRRRINEIVSEQRQKMNGAQADEREAGCSAQYNGEKGIGR